MKSNPKVSDIRINKERLKQLESKLKSPRFTSKIKYETTRKYPGGVCCSCEGVPKKLVEYDVGNAKLIERYCDDCFMKWVEQT